MTFKTLDKFLKDSLFMFVCIVFLIDFFHSFVSVAEEYLEIPFTV